MNKLIAFSIAVVAILTVHSAFAHPKLSMKDYDDKVARNVMSIVEPANISADRNTLKAVREAGVKRLPASEHVLRSNPLRLILDLNMLNELAESSTADDLFDVTLFEDVTCRVRTTSINQYSDSSVSWSGTCVPNKLDRFYAKATIKGDRIWWSGSLQKDGQTYMFESLPDDNGFGVTYQLNSESQIKKALNRDRNGRSDMHISQRAIKWKEQQEEKTDQE